MSTRDSIEELEKDVEKVASGDAEDWNPPTGTFAQFSEPRQPRPWLVDGLILHTYQPIMLAGAPGSSKSLLGSQLCREVSLGKPFMGRSTLQLKSLYITFEDSVEDLHQRHSKNTPRLNPEKDTDNEPHFMYLGGEDFDFCHRNPQSGRIVEGSGYDKLLKWVIKRDIRFIVGDHLTKFFPENENDRALVNGFGDILTRFCKGASCQWLMLAHTNKAGIEYSGSSANAGIYRQVMILTAKEDIYTLTVQKSNHTRAGKTERYIWKDWYCEHLSEADYNARKDQKAAERAAAEQGKKDVIAETVRSIMEPGKEYTAPELIALAELHSTPTGLALALSKSDYIIKTRRQENGNRVVRYSLAP